MEIELYINKKKEIYSILLEFIDSSNDFNDDFLNFIANFNKIDFNSNQEKILDLLRIISKIASNHQRPKTFFEKIRRIFQNIIPNNQSLISLSEILDIFQSNRTILLFLLEQEIIIPDESNLKILMNYEINGYKYKHLLYSAIKKYIDNDLQNQIESEIKQIFNEKIESFNEKVKTGENDSYISQLIRDDSVEQFISFINRTNISLNSTINPNIFETNSFLLNRKPSLIEYATFFGSIQIFQYLKYSKVKLNSSLWLYAIHSNNPDMIHILEENEIKPNDETFLECFKESVKCHHNCIANYIKDNLMDQSKKNLMHLSLPSLVLEYHNYYYLPDKIVHMIQYPENEYGFDISKVCFSLKQITIPPSITFIRNYAFNECSSLEEINIHASVTSIGKGAFKNCSSLKKISIPPLITSIKDETFMGCKSLTQMIIPSFITSIGSYSFFGCTSLSKIKISSSISKISKMCFSGCTSLIDIEIPSSISLIDNGAFSNCSSLSKVSFEADSLLTSIESSAFGACISLVDIKLPSSLKSIGYNAFYRCSSLKEIIIPSLVNSIDFSTFSYCKSLQKVTFDNDSMLTLIGTSAFSGCFSLSKFMIPSSVTTINDCAFSGCSSLKQINIPSSVNSFGYEVFDNCSSLKQLTIPSSVYHCIRGISDHIKLKITY